MASMMMSTEVSIRLNSDAEVEQLRQQADDRPLSKVLRRQVAQARLAAILARRGVIRHESLIYPTVVGPLA